MVVRNNQPRNQILLLTGITILLFIPFSGKPFHIDSPVTLYIAEQLLKNPLNPPAGEYGALLAPWNHTDLPATSAFHATPHPPLISYYTAVIISLFGTGEYAVNWAFFPFYCGTVLLFFLLCGRLGIRRRFSLALLFAVSPALYINAQNIMYDVPLAFFCIASFERMFRNSSTGNAIVAGLFAGVASLIKFTAGTLCIAGVFYYITQRKPWSLVAFTLAAALPNIIWLLHNLYFFDGWQLTRNGHARYLLGDIRYRFERMIAYIGSGYFFPVFTIVLWWLSRLQRRIGLAVGCIVFIWSILLLYKLHYSVFSAFFYWLCAFSGSLLVLQLTVFCIKPNIFAATDKRIHVWTLSIHTLAQMTGGLFLTLYAVRYTLPFIFIFIIISGILIETCLSEPVQRLFTVSAVVISLSISLLLSVNDYQIVNAERKAAFDLRNRYPEQSIYFKGRLGYLYYMHRIKAKSLTLADATPQPGDLILRNCFNDDDLDFFLKLREKLTCIDSLTYPVAPLKVAGGNAGFYGNDRLPYALDCTGRRRIFKIYRMTE